MTNFGTSLAEYSRRLNDGVNSDVNHFDLECVRLSSFRNCMYWNHSFSQLAANGFYYDHSCGVTKCFFCGRVLPNDLPRLPLTENVHRSNSRCAHVKTVRWNPVDLNFDRYHSLLSNEPQMQSNNNVHTEHEETPTKQQFYPLQCSARQSSDSGYSSRASNVHQPAEKMLYMQETSQTANVEGAETVDIYAMGENIEDIQFGVYRQTEIIDDDYILAYLESPAARANIETDENRVLARELVRKALEILIHGDIARPSGRMIASVVLSLKEHQGEILKLKNDSLHERQTAKEEIRKAKEHNICRICSIHDRSMVFLPCGHLVCKECSEKISGGSNPTCPFCRGKINGTAKVFIS